MRTRRKKGKVITTFWYRRNGHNIEVELRLITNENGQLAYLVEIDEPQITITGLEAEKVRLDTISALDEKCLIEWRKVIRCVVGDLDSRFARSRGDCVQVEFTWEPMEIGTTMSGMKVHRDGEVPGHRDFSRHIHSGDGLNRDDATIDDTPENRAKIETIVQGMRRLSSALSDLLSQDKILTTLENVKVLGLPAPKG
jgi:hypothetical protein